MARAYHHGPGLQWVTVRKGRPRRRRSPGWPTRIVGCGRRPSSRDRIPPGTRPPLRSLDTRSARPRFAGWSGPAATPSGRCAAALLHHLAEETQREARVHDVLHDEHVTGGEAGGGVHGHPYPAALPELCQPEKVRLAFDGDPADQIRQEDQGPRQYAHQHRAQTAVVMGDALPQFGDPPGDVRLTYRLSRDHSPPPVLASTSISMPESRGCREVLLDVQCAGSPVRREPRLRG